jgi:hypothetical protein
MTDVARGYSLRALAQLLPAASTCLLASLLFPAQPLVAQTRDWRIESVDAVGKFTSITADRDGNIHLSYSDGQFIKYGFRPVGADSKWFTMNIGSGNTYTSIALDPQNHPHVCYTANVLRYARFDGSLWKTETIATDNAPIYYSCSIAISPDGSPHISWYREKNPDSTNYLHIKYAELQNGAWVIRTLDFEMQTGKWESMAIDPNGNPVLSFDAFVKGLLKFAHKTGTEWSVDTVDFRGHTNNAYDLGMGNSIAFDRDGKPVISYEDGETIKFAHLVGNSWKVESVDSFHPLGGWVGYKTAVAVDHDNHPHIAYDAGGTLKHAYWDGQKWRIETLAHSGAFGTRFCSMTIDKNNTIYISYADPEDGSLKVAVGLAKAGTPVTSASDTKP